MKKLVLSFLVICSIFTMTVSSNQVGANDFAGNESKYIKLCSSSSLKKSDKKTCEEFNEYLRKKNSNLKNEIKETKKELSDTNNDISQVSSKINTLNSEISSKESEINYLLSSIEKVKKDITKKEEQMKQRLYVMQTTYNSNWMLDFLFGAEDFTTFFSRLTSLNDITSYEKELVADLTSFFI